MHGPASRTRWVASQGGPVTASRPRVLAILPGFYPSTIIGVSKPLQRLHTQGTITLDLTLQALVSRAAIRRAEVVVLCGEAHPRSREILDWVREADRPLVYELDDNRLEIPPEIPGLDYARDPAQRALVLACIQQADVVRVYSPALRELVLPHNARTELVGGPLDWSLVPSDPVARRPNTVRLVYATSRRQDRVSQMVIAPLQQALEAAPQAELTIWGPSIREFEHHPQVRHLPFMRNYDRFFRRFAREGFDIGLAPLPDDLFHRGKSNNKFREYAASGVAGLYSDMPVYNTCVVHGRTGLLVSDDPESWRESLTRLIEDATLRTTIAANAREEARRLLQRDTDWRRVAGNDSRPCRAPPSLAGRHRLTGFVAGQASRCDRASRGSRDAVEQEGGPGPASG